MITIQELQSYATQVTSIKQLPKSARYYKSEFTFEPEYMIFDLFVSATNKRIKYYFRIVPVDVPYNGNF